MTIIGLIIFVLVMGVVLWLLRGRIDETIHNILIFIIILVVILWLLATFHLIPWPAGMPATK